MIDGSQSNENSKAELTESDRAATEPIHKMFFAPSMSAKDIAKVIVAGYHARKGSA